MCVLLIMWIVFYIILVIYFVFMNILAIESSCDETSVSHIYVDSKKIKVFRQITSSSIKTHKKFGGIVPEQAARKQLEYIIPSLSSVLPRKKLEEIEAIAVTQGPGLSVSLQVGVDTAKTISLILKKPLIPVNHIEGHIYSPFIPLRGSLEYKKKILFPSLALIVSGGHTMLVLIKDYLKYKIVGNTRDDAAGEAFDKGARLLGLPYPGGIEISKLAEKGNSEAFDFPRGMIKSSDLDFSFSGLKTSLLYMLQKDSPEKLKGKYLYDICASYQQAIVDSLVYKTKKAVEKYKIKSLWVGGGVSANSVLRKELKEKITVPVHIASMRYTIDNASMIGFVGYLRYVKGDYVKYGTRKFFNISSNPNMKLK